MATYIKTLSDINGNVILPKTRSNAVYMGDNTTVEDFCMTRVSRFWDRELIPENTDLNTFIRGGCYRSSGAATKTLGNIPWDDAALFLDVWYMKDTMIKQVAIGWGTPRIAMRYTETGTSGWSEWKRLDKDVKVGNGLSVASASQAISMAAASATSAGAVTTGAQEFAGTKTFKSPPVFGSSDISSVSLTIKTKLNNLAPIRFYDADSGTSYGHNMIIQGGGNTLIGAGEAVTNLWNLESDTISNIKWRGDTEQLLLASDGNIYFYTNCQTIANRKMVYINANGALIVPHNTDYTTSKARNTKFSTTVPSSLNNGEICLVYQ